MECSSCSTTILDGRSQSSNLSNAIEWIYTASFCSNSAQHLRSISEEILFCCFVTTLNDTFEWELALDDSRYAAGSESLSIPTLCRTPHLYHVSASDNLSFGPATPQAYSPQQPGNLNAMCCHLIFEENDNSSIDSNPLHARTEHYLPAEHQMACHLTSKDKDEEEHFPTAPLDDDICMEGPVLDRHLCIHEHSQHDLCPYPCPCSLNQLHLSSHTHQHLSTWTPVTSLTFPVW